MASITNQVATNNVRYYIGKVEEIDENFLIRFSIPDIMDNLSKYPIAYPRTSEHIQETIVGDSVYIIQPDVSTQFFFYYPTRLTNFVGLQFGKVMVDITDGKTVKICTDISSDDRNDKGSFDVDAKKANVIIDGEKNTITVDCDGTQLNIDGQSKQITLGSSSYSLNEFFNDLDNALQSFQSKGSPAVHTATDWYMAKVKPFMTKIKQVFPK